MMLTIELVAHMEAADRRAWKGEQDERPLIPLGQRQAERFADLMNRAPIDALFVSPALRSRQTLAPLAERTGLSLTVVPELSETGGFPPPAGWDDPFWEDMRKQLGGAFAAGRGQAALRRIQMTIDAGRVVACSHGDLIPVLLAAVAAANGLRLPPAPAQRGDWHTLRFEDGKVAIDAHEPPVDFPR